MLSTLACRPYKTGLFHIQWLTRFVHIVQVTHHCRQVRDGAEK